MNGFVPWNIDLFLELVAQTRVFCLKERATTNYGRVEGRGIQIQKFLSVDRDFMRAAESERNGSGSTDGKLGVALLFQLSVLGVELVSSSVYEWGRGRDDLTSTFREVGRVGFKGKEDQVALWDWTGTTATMCISIP